MNADTFAPMMRDVAIALFGLPNQRLSNAETLRWGNHGSLKVDLADGVWHDKEANEGGGVLDLVMRERGCDKAGALAWLEGEGLIAPREQAPGKPIFYDYRDEAGAVLFKVERRGKGNIPPFLQHGPDGNGGFVARKDIMQGVRLVPYRLPELIVADPAAIVFICEGEKDADRLARLGLVATTSPGGAGKFRAEFAPLFADRRVAVLEDNDQAGRDHAADVVAKLDGVAADAVALKLPGLPQKGDVSDWLNNGGSAFQLLQIAETALGTDALPLPTLDLAALAKTRAKAKPFAIERIAPLAETTLFTGPGSAGKSLLGQQLATAGAAGLPCLGLNVQPGPTLYLTCEDDAEQLHWRQEHLCAAMGSSMASLANKLHLVSLRGELGNELATFTRDGKMTPAVTFQRIASMLRKTGAKLAFLDNVAHLFTGNENDRGDVTRFVNLLNRLAGETGAAIVLLGHPNKHGDEWSGSTAWPNAVRSRIYLEHDEDSDIRTLTLPKANYGQKGEVVRFRWFDWAFWRDEDLPADTRAELAEVTKANGENAAFLRCLAQRTKERRHVSEKVGANYAPKIFATMVEAKGMKKERLVEAMDRLFRIGAIERGFLWRDTAEGKDIFGLRETGNVTGNRPETTSANDRKPAESDRKTHPIDTTYQSGAASQSAAPEDDDLDWGDNGEGE
ncbi:AAA family ATPase [Tsuneonella sp. CC-YZS046]|uniref:AAA family ATPase n=1 Tax=Tsuneonella sp. CC-YZS046 TaxID=3042152 RepID=UPI002D776C98|nr:AAA family ATPase [Tsuneonella sp. CC-YZS046]WRO67009.1 AAA family ATPase [Tsuneonella sp. CC-YZS046]